MGLRPDVWGSVLNRLCWQAKPSLVEGCRRLDGASPAKPWDPDNKKTLGAPDDANEASRAGGIKASRLRFFGA